MKNVTVISAAFLLSSSLVHAAPTTWQLLNGNRDVMGTFLLDIDNQTTSGALIGGDNGTYTNSSRTYLNAANRVGPFVVNNYLKFFSSDTGRTFRTDFGGGEYNEIRVNDLAIEIGTLGGVLVPGGGTYAAYINEIFNFDETSVYCSVYEEFYDPDTGDITAGPCQSYQSDTQFNQGFDDYGYGGYLRSLPTTGAVPIPAAGWFFLTGLLGLGIHRMRATGGQVRAANDDPG